MTAPIAPYRSTPIFDQESLPLALRNHHQTKEGVWGLIQVLEGELKLTILDPPSEVILTPGNPAVVQPGQIHFVTPSGPMKMQVSFFNQPPS